MTDLLCMTAADVIARVERLARAILEPDRDRAMPPWRARLVGRVVPRKGSKVRRTEGNG